jgi:hypothetical protein
MFAPSSSEFIPFLTCHHSITDFEINAFLNQDSYRLLKFVSEAHEKLACLHHEGQAIIMKNKPVRTRINKAGSKEREVHQKKLSAERETLMFQEPYNMYSTGHASTGQRGLSHATAASPSQEGTYTLLTCATLDCRV